MTVPSPRIQLTESQHAVYSVLLELAPGQELHNAAVAERVGFSTGWTSEVLRSLEQLGIARRRVAPSLSDKFTRFTLWRIAWR
jgi:hypothetical protein